MRTLWLLLLGLPVFSFGQYDSVDFENLDVHYLTALVKIKVDSIRQSHGQQPLQLDLKLEQAAADQAEYLRYKRKMTHYQPSRTKNDVMDRARYYGARRIKKAGENVVWKYPKRLKKWDYRRKRYKELFYYSYNKLALEIVGAWVRSPRHFYVMLLPEFKNTGIAIAYNRKDVTLVAVQVFGEYYR